MVNSFKVAALSYSFSKQQSNMQKKTVFSQLMQMPDTKRRLIFPWESEIEFDRYE